MAFLNDEAWQGKVYSGGWITSDGGDTAVIEPATGRELGRIGLATPDDVTRAVKLAAAAQPAWAATAAHRAVRDPAPGGRHLAGQRRRDRGLGDQGERQDRRRRGLRDPQLHPGDLRGGHAARPALRRAAAERAAPAELRRAGPGRRRRRDLAVQLPADPGHPLGRPGARARQRGGAQAGPAHLGLRRRRARPGLRGGRPARGPAARAARRPGHRRGADHRPAGADHLVHRLHRRRPSHRRAGRPPPQADAPGAGRQLRPGHPRRRRRGQGGLGRRLGLVPAPGADLHDHRQAPGPRGGLRRLRGGAVGEGLAPPGRRPGLRARSRSARSSTSGSGTRCTRW